MYATKQAMIAKDRSPNLQVTFFYMDIRPMGKDYERYYERAKNEYQIDYKRCAIHRLRSFRQRRISSLPYVKENGTFVEQELMPLSSLWILLPPVRQGSGPKDRAPSQQAGILPDDDFLLPQTSIQGSSSEELFAAPKDIPESVSKDQAQRPWQPHFSTSSSGTRRQRSSRRGILGRRDP